MDHRFLRPLAAIHATYFLFGGLWPLLHMPSFEAVTGPKSDHWLVRTVAAMLVVVGAALMRCAVTNSVDRSMRWVAPGVSLALGLVAIVTSLQGWISALYLIDGADHLVLAGAWLIISRRATVDVAANQ